MTAQRVNDTLRRAEFELVMAGERRLANQVAAIRHGTCALLRAMHAAREATTADAERAAQTAVIAALADLNREPRR